MLIIQECELFMIKMDVPNINPDTNFYQRLEDRNYESPYVEISSDSNNHFSDTGNSSLDHRKASINSFLEEAEIITNSSEQELTKANQCMRKKLKSFFMNPLEKWSKRGRFPWKLCVQLIKIIIATAQMSLFGHHSFAYMKQHLDMTTALSRMLLKDWSLDVAVYPPSNGPYSVYTIPDFYDHIDNVIQQYSKLEMISIGSIAYDSPDGSLLPMTFCKKQFEGDILAENFTIRIDSPPKETCLEIPILYPAGNASWNNFSIETFLQKSNFTLNFKTLFYAKLYIKLKSVFIKSMNKLDFPECYKLKLITLYDNSEHDGQMTISLTIKSTKTICHLKSSVSDQGEDIYYLLRQLMNSFVIVFCFLSAILCARSIFSGYKLSCETSSFFKKYYHKEIPASEVMDFIDFWYVNIIVSDILLVLGSTIKIQIEERSAEGSEYARCSIFLGIGNLLIWIGILRYLGFFPKYNMLILTVRRALPNVMRFLVCAILLFLGSCFCGWIVLAPYHIKFRTLSRTAECLFSIMNGDDMFATFALLDTQLNLVWWFTRIFLYSFLLVFVYIVVSLFISVIMDTFETIKHIYVYGAPPRTMVEVFLSSEIYVSESSSTLQEIERPPKVNVFRRFWNWVRLHPLFL